MKRFLIILLALLLVQCAVSPSLAATYTTYTRVETDKGVIQGYTYDGVSSFLGIPYATAGRFEEPQPVAPWDGVKLAVYVGEVAPTNKTTTSGAEFITPSGVDSVENEATCLNLNVWTTTTDPEAKLPVLFWIHGGGFSSGSSIELTYYEGYNLAASGECVFVSVNHRLNVLGYLDLSGIGEAYKYTGNLGHLDLIAALEWVHNNIAKFGGDPDNVTIDGQSGGGSKVTVLMGMPAAQPYFAKAVVQSGGISATTSEASQAKTRTLFDNLGLTYDEAGVQALREMSFVDLLAAANKAGAGSGPVVDGDLYPVATVVNDQWMAEGSVDKPLMIGTALTEIAGNNVKNIARAMRFPADGDVSAYCLDDMDENKFQELLAAKFGDNAQAAVDAFAKAYPNLDVRHVLFTVTRNDNVAAAKSAAGGAAYSYIFSYEFPIFGGCCAWHTGGDIPFFFRNIDKVDYMIAGDRDGAHQLEATASRAMLNFLKTGDPSAKDCPWEAYTAENGAVMVFDVNSEVRFFHDKELQEIFTAK